MNDEKYVSDMYLAAAYLSYGAALVGIDKTETRRLKFIFSGTGLSTVYYKTVDGEVEFVNSPTMDDVERLYVAKTLMFPPAYPDSVRTIKTAIHLE